MSEKPQRPRSDDSNEHFSGALGLVIDTTGIGMWDWHLPSGHVVYSDQWERIAGYEPGELPQVVESWENALLPADLDHANAVIGRYIQEGGAMYEVEFRMRRKDGSIIWAQDKGTITEWDADGNPVRLVGVLQDVTRLKRAEELVKEKSEQMDFAAHLSGLGSWDWNLTKNKITYSDEYLRMMDYTQEEINGSLEEWASFIHPDDLDAVNSALDDYIAGRTDGYSIEMRMRHKDGHYIWTLDMGRIVEWDEDGRPERVLGGHLNIQRSKEAEEKLQAALHEIELYNEGLQGEVRRGQQDLRRMQETNQAMFEANPHINLIFDEGFRLINCNPAAQQLIGAKTKEEFLESFPVNLSRMLPGTPEGSSGARFERRMRTVMAEGNDDFETTIQLNGEEIPMHIVMKRIQYQGGYAVAMYLTDLRSIRKAEEDLARQDKLLKAVNQAAAMLMSADQENFDDKLWLSLGTLGSSLDVNRVRLWKNSRPAGVLHGTLVREWRLGVGMHEPTPAGSVIMDEVVPDWRETLQQGHSISGATEDIQPPLRDILRGRGAVSALYQPVFIDGEFWGVISYEDNQKVRLYTEAEEQILRSGGMIIAAGLLRNEITQSLILATEAALESTKAKSRFLANMSHEIRTPMNAIIGMTTIAKNTRDVEKIQESLEKIAAASKHLLGIINDVLDMSKIEARKFELAEKEFSFQDMVDNLTNMNAGRMEEKHQHFVVEIAPEVPDCLIGDELRISQVITNLLSNAMKFTPEQGTIRLSARQLSSTTLESLLEISVEDDGIGIQPEKLHSLFRAFEQAEVDTVRTFGGTGLGLAISRNIVQMMGGEIRVESTYGEGSKFIFTIRVKRGSEVARRRATRKTVQKPEHYDFTGKHILLVEDIFINREIVLSLLEDTRADIDCAENGLEAYEIFQKNPEKYDLIFMDVHMPVMDGFAATQKIRALDFPRAKTVPIVAMTANAFAEDIEKCLSVGMNDHIAKPIDLDTLLEKTQQYIYREEG